MVNKLSIASIVLVCGFINQSACQVKSASYPDVVEISSFKTYSRSFELDPNRVYNLHSGEKIDPIKFAEMINGKPFTIKREIDNYGRIAKYLYDTTGDRSIIKKQENFNIGEFLLPFDIISLRGKEIKFDELRGKNVIVRFEMFVDQYDFENKRLLQLENQLSEIDETIGIIFFLGSKEKLDILDTKGTQFNLVLQGANFHERYGVIRIPTTILINKEGIVVDIFYRNDEIDLSTIK